MRGAGGWGGHLASLVSGTLSVNQDHGMHKTVSVANTSEAGTLQGKSLRICRELQLYPANPQLQFFQFKCGDVILVP